MRHTIFLISILLIHNGGKIIAQDRETDITHILDKGQFEAVVQYVLDNGSIEEAYSSLWGASPYLLIRGINPKVSDTDGDLIQKSFSIILIPDLRIIRFPTNPGNKEEWFKLERYDNRLLLQWVYSQRHHKHRGRKGICYADSIRQT